MHEIRASVVRGERRETLASKGSRASGASGEVSLAAIRIRREEARRCDQRREDRNNVIERAGLTWQRRTHEVSLLNVSSHGAMIETDLRPRIGARVHLRVADCNPLECFVRWVRDGRVGVEFGCATIAIVPRVAAEPSVSGRRAGEQPTISARKERAPRQRLLMRGELHCSQRAVPVRVRNISAEGAMLEATRDFAVGTEVVLQLPSLPPAAGRVRWCRSKQVGIRFEEAFNLTALAQPHARTGSTTATQLLKPDYLQTERDPDSPWAARWERLTPNDL